MAYYRAGLLTTSFRQVINAIEKEFREKIFLIRAYRTFNEEVPVNTKILSYLTYRETLLKEISLSKESEVNIPNPEWIKIIDTIRERGFVDLTVTRLGFVVENTELSDILEKLLGKKIVNTKFVILFKSSTSSAKEEKLKRWLKNTMKDEVDKLDLKYATIELDGIYTLQDYRSERRFNFLTTEKINLDKKVVTNMITSMFKPTIKISGHDTRIRFIKWYEMSKGNILKLTGAEEI